VKKLSKTVAVIVAHPDDETLWAGGAILSHPRWNWFVVCLTRGHDPDRSMKFHRVLNIFKAEGIMGDMDDRPDQKPMDGQEVERTILELLPLKHYDLVISHNPTGEYTRHLRHEETGTAVIRLWDAGKISTSELMTFAYEDGGGKYRPRPVENATICNQLPKRIWVKKYSIITDTYGFSPKSFEAETTPRTESFWKFTNSHHARLWLIESTIRRP
jgi:LmbE family N-acetylglucosaminyl deacetylase